MARRGGRSRRQPRTAGPSTKGLRTCLGTRERLPREDMIRLVCDAAGRVMVDRYLKAPGRGAHLAYDREAIEQAVKRRAFGRAFGCAVQPVELEPFVAEVVAAIEHRIADGLALGRRAGRTVSGLDSIGRARGRVRLLVVAGDASDTTAAALRRQAEAADCPVWVFGDRELLGGGQGKPARVAVGVLDPALAARLNLEFERRARVRGDTPAD